MRFKQILIFFLSFIALERFCYFQTHGFSPLKIRATHPFEPRFSVDSPLPSSLENKLSSKLYFLGSGKQFYAFETEDKSTVIKFVKQSRRAPLPYLEKLKLPKPLNLWKKNYLQARKKRLDELLTSCTIAYQSLQKETALHYIHLNPSSTWHKEVILVDNLGIEHKVDLEKTAFIIQKKGSKIAFTPKVIDSLISLTLRQCQKGIANADPLIERNYGLLGEKAINLDCGSFVLKKELKIPARLKEEVFIELLSLRQYLKTNDPILLKYFDEKITEILNSL